MSLNILDVPTFTWGLGSVHSKEDATLRVEYLLDLYKALLHFPSNYIHRKDLSRGLPFSSSFCEYTCHGCFLKDPGKDYHLCLWQACFQPSFPRPKDVVLRKVELSLRQYPKSRLAEEHTIVKVIDLLEGLV